MSYVRRQIDSKGRVDVPDGYWSGLGVKDYEFVYVVQKNGAIELRKSLVNPTPPPTPPPVTPDLQDDFSQTYELAGGQVSTDGKWRCMYTGYGKVESINGAFHEYPKTSTASDGNETHACLTLSTKSFTDFQLDVDIRTNKQLRQNFPPKNWEVAWIMFRYYDPTHHYYVSLKNVNTEFGKKDNTEFETNPEDQHFLPRVGDVSVKIGTYQHVTIVAKGNHITITVDGTKVVDYTDTPSKYANGLVPLAQGQIGLYTEDADVSFDNVKLVAV